MAEALRGTRVVEVADDVAAAYCARQLAAWGADVVVAEPPEGSPLRSGAPSAPGTGASLLWEYTAAGKRSMVVGSDEQLSQLIDGADVLVTDRLPVPAVPPRVVTVSVTPFGLSGPYADLHGTDLIVQALSGYMSLNGEMGRPPLRIPGNILAYACGVSAFGGALAALRERDRSGRGQLVEVARMEVIATMLPFVRAQYTGKPGRRGGGPSTGLRLVPTEDGYVSLSVIGTWPKIIDALLVCGVDVPADTPRPAGLREIDDACARLSVWTRQVTCRQLVEAMRTVERQGTLFDRMYEPAQLPSHEQLVARDLFFTLDHPQVGRLPFAGPAAKLARTPMRPPRPAPALGDTGPWPPREPHAADRSEGRAPLDGIRIVDLTQAWIGPYASLQLADLGAELIKVESHKQPDVWRFWRAARTEARLRNPDAHPGNVNANFNSVNRDKESLCLDLSTDDGRKLLFDLVRKADIVMENYRSGALERLGLSDSVLREANPDLVIASFSGYGRTGPYADFHANGVTIEAVSGWDAVHGYPGGPPMHMGLYQADAITGLQMTALTLLALLHRDRTGVAQTVDGSMHDAAVGYIGELVMHASLGGELPRSGNRHPSMAPHGAFPCRGADEWVAIAVRDDSDWEAMLNAAPELDDPRLVTAEGRLTNVDELEERVARWTAQRSARQAMDTLQGVGVPAGAVQHIDEALDDPHLAARGWFVPLEHPDMGLHRYNGSPWRSSEWKRRAHSPSPRLGEHSSQVLAREHGLSADDIARLYDQGVTATLLQRDEAASADERTER